MKSHNNAWKLFVKIMVSATDEKEMQAFLQFFLTSEEREMIASRMVITKALLEGDKPQRTIAEQTQISIAKITRGSNELKRCTATFKKYLINKLLKKG